MLKIHNVLESFGHNFAITNAEDYLQNLDKQAKVHDLEKHIDQLVHKSYTLTPEEIVIVEGEGKL